MMIAGVVIGIGMGVGMRKYDFDNLDAAYIAFPGTMLIQGLKMLVIPLVVFSIIAGVSRLERDVTGKIGGYACAYYAVTTFLAVILGIILCAGIKPGVDRENRGEVDPSKRSNDSSPVDTILDIIRQLLPPNIVYALFAQVSIYKGFLDSLITLRQRDWIETNNTAQQVLTMILRTMRPFNYLLYR